MRSKYDHQYLQQEEELEEHHHHQRSKFLPMLCSSSSTKQVMIKLSDHQGRRHRRCSSTSSTTSSAVSDEPLSPRVGCMGQVKRNNKVGIISNTSTTTSVNTATTIKNDQIISNNYTSNSIVKYYKLKRFFSSKSLTGSPTTTIAAAAVTRNGTHKGKVRSVVPYSNKGARPNTVRHDHHHHHHSVRSRSSKIDENYAGSVTASNNKNNEDVKGCLVNLVELDPPLPVVKQQQGNNNGEGVNLWKRRSGGAPLKSLHLQAVPQSCNLLLQATTV